jgi:tRNA-dihydrouridine synthase
VAIHGRTRHQTYDVSADWKRVHCLARLAKSLNPRLQVFLSGDVALSPRHCSPQPHHHHHQHHYCDPSLIDGLLYARSAQWNVSLLSPSVSDVSSVSSSNGLSSLERVICEYLDVAWRFGAHEANVKYALVEMLTQPADFCPAPDYAQHVGQLRRRTLSPVYKAKTLAELMAIFGVEHDQAESAAGVATDSELVEWGYSADKQHARLHAKMQTQ